jgi:hypothetical protein
VLHTPDIKKSIETQLSGSVPQSSPAQFAKDIRTEADVWKSLFAEMKFVPA